MISYDNVYCVFPKLLNTGCERIDKDDWDT